MILNWDKIIEILWPPMVDALFPCVAGLGWSDQLVDECEGKNLFELHDVRPRLASGCIFELLGTWYFLTAGHVLDGMKEDRDKGRTQFQFHLYGAIQSDCSGRNFKTRIEFDEGKNLSCFRSSGLDYGLVPINDRIRKILEMKGVRCVPVETIARPDERFDGYVLIGFAHEEFKVMEVTDTPRRRNMAVRIGVQILPVEQSDDGEIPDHFPPHNPFTGKIISLRGVYPTGESVELKSIVGMSGGPIFGFRIIDDRAEIRLVAVQSHWIESERTIAGSRVAYLLAALDHFIGQLRREGLDLQGACE